jgi:hypothetical protein
LSLIEGNWWNRLWPKTDLEDAYFFLADPELVKERSQIRPRIKSWDMVLASVSFLFFYPFTLAVAGFDVGRFGWSPSLSWVVQAVALAVFALGNCLALWAALSNRYFSTRLQTDNNAQPRLEPTGLVSALFECSTRFEVVGWRRRLPAPARRLNQAVSVPSAGTFVH